MIKNPSASEVEETITNYLVDGYEIEYIGDVAAGLLIIFVLKPSARALQSLKQ